MSMRTVVFIMCIVCAFNFFDVLQAKSAKPKKLIQQLDTDPVARSFSSFDYCLEQHLAGADFCVEYAAECHEFCEDKKVPTD